VCALAVGALQGIAAQQTPSDESDQSTVTRLREQIRQASIIRVHTATNRFVLQRWSLSDSAIAGEGVVVPLRDLVRVQRRGSAWSSGLLVGIVVGGVGGLIGGSKTASNFCQGGCTNQGAGGFLGALGGAAAGGLLGAGVGSLFQHWYTIYDRSN
jgi:hypothetical protein